MFEQLSAPTRRPFTEVSACRCVTHVITCQTSHRAKPNRPSCTHAFVHSLGNTRLEPRPRCQLHGSRRFLDMILSYLVLRSQASKNSYGPQHAFVVLCCPWSLLTVSRLVLFIVGPLLSLSSSASAIAFIVAVVVDHFTCMWLEDSTDVECQSEDF